MSMKKISILCAIAFMALTLAACSDNDDNSNAKRGAEYVGGGNKGKNFAFKDKISPEVLNNYLSRAIIQMEFLSSEGFYNDGAYPSVEDDERMILGIGAKFIGRALYNWGFEDHFNNPKWLSNAKSKMERIHAVDPDIIFQCSMFEVITPKVEQIDIPAWVFEAFGLPVENRKFSHSAMRFKDKYHDMFGPNSSVPDMTKLETRMYFYYMSIRYMEVGFEALNYGQVMLMGEDDAKNNWEGWRDLLGKVREKAKTMTRRGMVLCDAHCYNIAVDGELLFDFASYPLRLKEITGEPMKAEIKKLHNDAIYGYSVGGITPSGWRCDRSPYMVEFDNFGLSDHVGTANIRDHFIWGYDEITWLYWQTEEYRNEMIWNIVNYLGRVDPIGFLQMSGSRVVTIPGGNKRYRCNTKSDACPEGLSQEETIKQIWGTK